MNGNLARAALLLGLTVFTAGSATAPTSFAIPSARKPKDPGAIECLSVEDDRLLADASVALRAADRVSAITSLTSTCAQLCPKTRVGATE